ncbi:methyl-accepting chemotaxis sensory transducer with phytochrome sensor [Calothrix parasitica NIES-267]|uniref:Methyl-accepting chemotaxis sensory transducer with phytochrome sensor n=1 Tax=Calothrix parasitica NIES-267 TaxID=1973488 RepID=A0A1Z4LZI5_9CYAN|nr:methyl-accepting chemotaxis sensory transducer with phytochrome sensor [Calothrix parasitica NIES-267]
MLNKTDSAKSGDTPEQETSLISSSNKTDNAIQLSSTQMTVGNTGNVSSNGLLARFKRLSLSTKTTILAMAMVTLPVLVIGTGAYLAASQSMRSKVFDLQTAEAKGFADKVNRFMFERYGDVQVISNLPTIKNSGTSSVQKKAVLDDYVNTYKVYDGIGIFNLNGVAIVRSEGANFNNQGDSNYFKQAKRNNNAVISQPKTSDGNDFIYIAAPIKNAANQLTSVAIARMPVKSLENLVKNYAAPGQEYHLANAENKIFLSAEPEYIGKELAEEYPKVSEKTDLEEAFTDVVKHDGSSEKELVSYIPSIEQIEVPGLPTLNWDVILAADASTAFAARGNLLLTIAVGTILTAIAVAVIAALLAKRATQPILNATRAVAKLGKGQFDTRLNVEAEDEIGLLNANINQMASQLQLLVKEQEAEAEREKLKADITLRIRRSLKLEDIYKAAVREIRQALKTDRVVIYEFNPETWDGTVVSESVSAGFPKMKGAYIEDPCFRERQVQMYKNGRVRAVANIYDDAGLKKADCYVQMLEKFAVKANLVAPILIQDNLMGLLIAHNCETPREWQQQEIDLFKQLATQIGFALEQAKLLEEVDKARQSAQTDSEDERHQKEELQMQLIELLSEVEGAAQGDLTVRADVTAGDIGTVADFFNSIVESLRDIVTQVKSSATKVNQAIGDNSGAISELADEALAQAAEITNTLDAVDEMTQSMQAVAVNAQEAATIANTARSTATNSGKAMELTVQNILGLRETVGETAKKVKRLGESTQQISRVVALINQISMQTNLLAINAGIEAARAGEEGQGFAVVAEEVGELAARSAAATDEIEQIVENIQRETTDVVQAMELGVSQVVEGTHIVEDAKLSLSQILEVSRQIDDLVQSISTTTNRGVETSHQVSVLMKEIAAVSQRTSSSSRKVSESLQQTVAISQQLQESVGTFKVSQE